MEVLYQFICPEHPGGLNIPEAPSTIEEVTKAVLRHIQETTTKLGEGKFTHHNPVSLGPILPVAETSQVPLHRRL